ncbi:MAG: hypothetical protein V1875_07715 [Candidatus Altiarchaeota archaeon]
MTAVNTGKKRPKTLPRGIRKKLLTREDGKTVPQTKGFYLVFIRGKGKNTKYKAVAWEYHAESNWCRTRKNAVEKVVSHPRLIIQ